MSKIRIGIVGYGNLGKGTELAIRSNSDMELCAVFSKRNPSSLKLANDEIPVYSYDSLAAHTHELDVLILCGGSATDLPVQTPELARLYNVVDSFDTHALIPSHLKKVDTSAKENAKSAIISVGWDPGLFSVQRLYGHSVMPQGKTYTFWGKGVSQGHSDAIRRIDGVLDAKQYTIPNSEAVESVRNGEMPELTTRQKHIRECFVVAEEGADLSRIEKEIVTMPNYFSDYDTSVHFISQEQLYRDHSGMPHGGFVFQSGYTGRSDETVQTIEYSLCLGSNPEFTAMVLCANARAVYRMNKEGRYGAFTIFDIPPVYFSSLDRDEAIQKFL